MIAHRHDVDEDADGRPAPIDPAALMFSLVVNQDAPCRVIAPPLDREGAEYERACMEQPIASAPPIAHSSAHAPLDAPELLDAEAMATLLGVSRKTVERWEDSGKLIAAVRVGRSRFWRRAEALEWIAQLSGQKTSPLSNRPTTRET